jgi:hypothetical protein
MSMHQNQLRFFEDLMHTEARAEQAEKTKKPNKNFDVSLIKREKYSVLQYLRELKFLFPKEKQQIRIINIYFERVIDLINQAHKLTPSPSKAEELTPYRSAMDALKEILSYLEEQYGKYMDLSICLPIPHEIELKNALVTAFLQFKETAQVGPALLEVIETVYADFVEIKERGKTTYYRACYLLVLITSLRRSSSATDEKVIQTLIAFNFNNPAFIKLQTQKLQESPETLALALKEINQINVMPGFVLNQLLPSVKDQLCAWLTLEIGYFGIASAAPKKKIMTTLSVPQLANMVKLFSEMGVIVHENKTELLESFAAAFRTEKVENISLASLRNHFYNDDASISRSVSDLLQAAHKKLKETI